MHSNVLQLKSDVWGTGAEAVYINRNVCSRPQNMCVYGGGVGWGGGGYVKVIMRKIN